jgi:uncharacterized membrane protein SirB2
VTLAVILKLIHVSCAFLSVAGFGLRGYWMMQNNALLQHRAVKRLPHVIDTLLLVSAIMLVVVLRLSPLDAPWLIAKIGALLVYIGLGLVALRFGGSKEIRIGAWLLALVAAGYIVSVAYTKTPLGFVQFLHY